MAQGSAAFSVADVFDVERFVADIESYCARHNIAIVDLSRITGISPSTVTAMRKQGTLSLQSAIVFAYVIDAKLDSYIRLDEIERAISVEDIETMKRSVMPVERPSRQDGRYSVTKQARNAAIKRLIARYQDEFNALLEEERIRLGLDPQRGVAEPVVPSATTWVPEPELTLDDRVTWAWPGERQLADENNEAVVEVVCRTIREDVPMDYATVTK